MKLVYLIIVSTIIISCKPKEMKITQLVDLYAKKNGEVPNDDVFCAKGFYDNKKSIKKVFQYINDSIRLKLPFKVSVNDCTIVFNENDVTYEDGTVEMNTKEYFWFLFNNENYDYFSTIILKRDYEKSPFTLKKSNIIISYKELNLNVLQNFFEIAKSAHKDDKLQTSFILVNKDTEKEECNLIYNNTIKGDAFKVVFN